ncbi:MAG: diaminopimelate decarboxylase [Candidatus Omnitrophica bacterium]|nr:diaminopimelate decarboxylase [Candidatus Omnitrophota bacterium]
MHDFTYRGNLLYCEKVKVRDLAERYGTPLYIYSYHTLTGHFLKLRRAFSDIRPLICYSVKANSNLAILKALVEQGAGLDIVSGGELYRALKAGCPPERIVYASVGKTSSEIEEAIRRKILFFNVESLPELEHINRIAGKLKTRTKVAIRINPDVEARTHAFITTGKITNKFGIDLKTAHGILMLRGKFAHVDIAGLHIHIGSQITEGTPFAAAIRRVIVFIGVLRREGIALEYLNIGGGLGIVYSKETPQTADEFAGTVLPVLKKSGLKIIMEPGRFIVGSAGILAVKVLYVKKTPLKKFIITDGGMNDLIRPALYGAHHEILPLYVTHEHENMGTRKFDIVGPICESGDFFAKERPMPPVREGDFLAVMTAGAYGFSMSSNYNSRPRAAEVMVKGGRAYLIRSRETYPDLTAQEVIPEYV